MNAITEWFSQQSFWSILYLVYAFFMLWMFFNMCKDHIKDRPYKKIQFIEKANKEGNMVVGKLSCLTLNGTYNKKEYHAEYMYVVDDKPYFVTYCMAYNVPIDNQKEEMNADMLLLTLKPALILFYDPQKPNKVLSKFEVFTSKDGIHQIDTPKRNVWRDTEKQWTEAINLVQY